VFFGPTIIAPSTGSSAFADPAAEWFEATAPPVRAILARLGSDYPVFDVCWSSHMDEARARLAGEILEQARNDGTLHIVAFPGVSSERTELGLTPIRDMRDRVIDRAVLRRHRGAYERDLDAALADVLDRVLEERPDIKLTVFAFQPRVDGEGRLSLAYPKVAERLDFVLQTPRTVSRDAANAVRAGETDVAFASVLVDWAKANDKGLLRLSPDQGWLLKTHSSSDLLSGHDGGDGDTDQADNGSADGSPNDTTRSDPSGTPDNGDDHSDPGDSTNPSKPSDHDSDGRDGEGSSVANEGTGAPPVDEPQGDGGRKDSDDRRWNELLTPQRDLRGAFDPPKRDPDDEDKPLTNDDDPGEFSAAFWAQQAIEEQQYERKVMVAIRGFNGDRADPAGLGRTPGWRVPNDREAIGWFKRRVRLFADVGARRFVFKNPAGARHRYPPNALRWIHRERKEMLRDAITQLKAEYPGLEIGLYVGSGIDPTPDDLDYSNDHVIAPDFEDADDRRIMLESYAEVPRWGFDFLFMDNISGKGGNYQPRRWMAWIENEIGIPTYGEAVPTTRDSSKYPPGPWGVHMGPDREEMDAWRYMALREFVETRSITTDGMHEHYVGFTGRDEDWRSEDNDLRRPIVDDFIERGFVPFIYERGERDAEVQIVEYAVQKLAEYEANRRSGDPASDGEK